MPSCNDNNFHAAILSISWYCPSAARVSTVYHLVEATLFNYYFAIRLVKKALLTEACFPCYDDVMLSRKEKVSLWFCSNIQFCYDWNFDYYSLAFLKLWFDLKPNTGTYTSKAFRDLIELLKLLSVASDCSKKYIIGFIYVVYGSKPEMTSWKKSKKKKKKKEAIISGFEITTIDYVTWYKFINRSILVHCFFYRAPSLTRSTMMLSLTRHLS